MNVVLSGAVVCVFFNNKNALSSVECRLLGGLVVKGAYFFVWNTKRVLYVIM